MVVQVVAFVRDLDLVRLAYAGSHCSTTRGRSRWRRGRRRSSPGRPSRWWRWSPTGRPGRGRTPCAGALPAGAVVLVRRGERRLAVRQQHVAARRRARGRRGRGRRARGRRAAGDLPRTPTATRRTGWRAGWCDPDVPAGAGDREVWAPPVRWWWCRRRPGGAVGRRVWIGTPVAYAASQLRSTRQIGARTTPRSTWSHCGSATALDQRVPALPSTAADAGKATFSSTRRWPAAPGTAARRRRAAGGETGGGEGDSRGDHQGHTAAGTSGRGR